MTDETNWNPYSAHDLPARDSKVVWIAPSGRVERGAFLGGTVWMLEGSACYVYYQPVFWRYDDETVAGVTGTPARG